jgi:curli production assembly/transport component CsgF
MTMNRYLSITTVAALLGLTGPSHATGLIYEPVNPTFGGNPLNGTFLLDTANAQNKYKDPSVPNMSSGSQQLSTLDQFNAQLQQAILSRVASSITNSIVGPNGQLQPGTISTGNFTINIQPAGNGNLQITTTDNTTGASTTFIVSNGQ